MSDYVQKSIQENVFSLGFSSHAPMPFEKGWCMKKEDLDTYLSGIEVLKSNASIEIYSGLEVDYIPNKISPKDFAHALDYTIGSIHFIDTLPDGTPWEIDGSHALFLAGYLQIFKSNIRDTICRYYELTRDMLDQGTPDILGHMDKIKIQNINDRLFSEDDTWYKDEIKKTIKAIKRNGVIVEVNTRGIYQNKTTTTYPSPWIIALLLQENIPLTISSDAHHMDDLTKQFTETAMTLISMHCNTLTTLTNSKWQNFRFNQHGFTK